MLQEFLEKFLLLSPRHQKSLYKIAAKIARLKEYKAEDGFEKITEVVLENRTAYEYSFLKDKNFSSKSGLLFRIYFYVKSDGVIYFSDFKEL